MTSDHPIRRFLARVCSSETMSRVVDPTLGDMRFERGRPTWRGHLALARALTIHTIASAPGALARICADDERAVPRVVAICLASALIVALPLVVSPMLGPLRNDLLAADAFGGMIMPRSARTLTMFVRLLPQALVLTLAPALLVALPLTLRGRPATARLVRRVMALAVISCAAMGVLVNWGTPLANQRFRVFISGNPQLPRGESETVLRSLQDRIESLRRNPKAVSHPRLKLTLRWLEYRYQMRLALIASPVPLALVAIALAATRAARRWPRVIGLLAMTGYVLSLFALDAVASFSVRTSSISPALFAWLPTATLLLLAGVTARVVLKPNPRSTLA